jgi:hypothetical protein
MHKNLATLLLATAGAGKLLEEKHRSGGYVYPLFYIYFISFSEASLYLIMT